MIHIIHFWVFWLLANITVGNWHILCMCLCLYHAVAMLPDAIKGFKAMKKDVILLTKRLHKKKLKHKIVNR